jgi:Tol biopolymer transport system component
MGVVYRGRDSKLQRDVALKLLPEHFADDADRLGRFQREAQLLASLNHPNIAQIYGLEQLGTSACIVMELVEGETLGEKLKRGPLPLDEAIAIARQIADALATAHEKGIVHRDLKPANIKVTPNGTVKILDFGLAKAVENRPSDGNLSGFPTQMASTPGMVLGTAGYMSPEQARGKDVDARTDIWAFGCVLYEMLTARVAFDGETATDMIAKIVTGQPDLDALPRETPSAIRLLLAATLNKNPQQRLQHIGDMRLFLDQTFFPAASTTASQPQPPSAGRRRMLVPVLVAVASIAALVAAAMYFRPAPPAAPAMRLEISLPGVVGGGFNLSPNGQRVAYQAQAADGSRALWIRAVGGETAEKLAGTENSSASMWSPDSRYLAVLSEGKLKKIDASGGPAQLICEIAGGQRGMTWNRAGVILFARASDNLLFRVSDSGGEAKPVTELDSARKETLHAVPVFLPDGNHFLYAIVSSVPDNAGIFVGALDSKSKTRVMPLPERLNGFAYAAPGYLLLNSGTLTAQRFDASRFAVEGAPIPLAQDIESYFSASDTGLLLYRKASTTPASKQLLWFDRAGKQTGQVGAAGNYGNVELSPNGDRVAVDMIANNNRDIWVIDVARAVPSRITFDASSEWTPSWSPDGSRIIFGSSRGNRNHIYQKSSSGIGNDELVFNSEDGEIPVNMSRDGRYVVFSRLKSGTNNRATDTWILNMSGDKKAVPFVESPFDKTHARVSPDGRWMAYSTNDSGTYQIVVQSFPDPNGGRWQITAQGGVEPKWRRDGRELYYLALDGKLMSVPLKADRTFEAGTPVPLFQTPLTVNRNQPERDRRYDVTPDGRFLIVTPQATPASTAVTAVVNWPSGLGER